MSDLVNHGQLSLPNSVSDIIHSPRMTSPYEQCNPQRLRIAVLLHGLGDLGWVDLRDGQALCGMGVFFGFSGGKDIHYTSAMIAISRACDVHYEPYSTSN